MKMTAKRKLAKKRETPKKKLAEEKAVLKKVVVKTKAPGKKTTRAKTAGALKKRVQGKKQSVDRRLSTKLCLRESSGSLEAGIETVGLIMDDAFQVGLALRQPDAGQQHA